MKKTIFSLLAALLLHTPAFAWVAMAYSPSHPDVHIAGPNGDPDTSIKMALEFCKKYSKAKNECRPLGRPISGEVAVVMLGDISWGVGYSKSPEKAMQAAVKDCKRLSTTCTLVWNQLARELRYAAVARSESEGYFVFVNSTSQAIADKSVLDLCKKNAKSKCTLDNEGDTSERGFYVIYEAEDGREYLGQYGTSDDAIVKGLKFCQERSKLPCRIVSGFPVENKHPDFLTEAEMADFTAIGRKAFENANEIRFPGISKMLKMGSSEQTSSRHNPAPKPNMGPCIKSRIYGSHESDVVATPGCFN